MDTYCEKKVEKEIAHREVVNNSHKHTDTLRNSNSLEIDDFEEKKSFKEKKTLHQRLSESRNIKSRFPAKVPVIIERYARETSLPALDKTKYLVPQELTMSQFVAIVRNRMKMNSNQALYFLVRNKTIVTMSMTMGELYHAERDEDGFVYITYASQEMFGRCTLASSL